MMLATQLLCLCLYFLICRVGPLWSCKLLCECNVSGMWSQWCRLSTGQMQAWWVQVTLTGIQTHDEHQAAVSWEDRAEFEPPQEKRAHLPEVREAGPIAELAPGCRRPRATLPADPAPHVPWPQGTRPVFQLWMNTADNLELALFSHLGDILQSPR